MTMAPKWLDPSKRPVNPKWCHFTICNVWICIFLYIPQKIGTRHLVHWWPPNPTYRQQYHTKAPQQITPFAPLQPPVNPLWMSLRTLSSTHLLLTFRSSSYGPTCKSWGPTSLRVWPLKTTPEACNFREILSRWDLMETILPQENLPFLDAFEAWNSLVNVKVQKVLY